MGAEKPFLARTCSLQVPAGKASRRRGRARRVKDRRLKTAPLAIASFTAPSSPVRQLEAEQDDRHSCANAEDASLPLEMQASLQDSGCEEAARQAVSQIEHVPVLEACMESQGIEEASSRRNHEAPLVRAASDPAIASSLVVQLEEPEAPEQPRIRRGRTWPLRVGFDLEVSVHSITPYAEIYGMHPRFFDFDKGFSMVPAQGFGAMRLAPSELVARPRQRSDADGEDEDTSSEDSFDDEMQDLQTETAVVSC